MWMHNDVEEEEDDRWCRKRRKRVDISLKLDG
jgi:hypothetical protein